MQNSTFEALKLVAKSGYLDGKSQKNLGVTCKTLVVEYRETLLSYVERPQISLQKLMALIQKTTDKAVVQNAINIIKKHKPLIQRDLLKSELEILKEWLPFFIFHKEDTTYVAEILSLYNARLGEAYKFFYSIIIDAFDKNNHLDKNVLLVLFDKGSKIKEHFKTWETANDFIYQLENAAETDKEKYKNEVIQSVKGSLYAAFAEQENEPKENLNAFLNTRKLALDPLYSRHSLFYLGKPPNLPRNIQALVLGNNYQSDRVVHNILFLNFSGVNFCNLFKETPAFLLNINFNFTKFDEANLSGCALTQCLLVCATFLNATLVGTYFEGSILSGADFTNSNLKKALFSLSSLSEFPNDINLFNTCVVTSQVGQLRHVGNHQNVDPRIFHIFTRFNHGDIYFRLFHDYRKNDYSNSLFNRMLKNHILKLNYPKIASVCDSLHDNSTTGLLFCTPKPLKIFYTYLKKDVIASYEYSSVKWQAWLGVKNKPIYSEAVAAILSILPPYLEQERKFYYNPYDLHHMGIIEPDYMQIMTDMYNILNAIEFRCKIKLPQDQGLFDGLLFVCKMMGCEGKEFYKKFEALNKELASQQPVTPYAPISAQPMTTTAAVPDSMAAAAAATASATKPAIPNNSRLSSEEFCATSKYNG
jgi:hypothetical protein